MHGKTLTHLYDVVVKAKNILDIGTGSGYLTAALAEIAPPGANIYCIDHIQAINDFARGNIQNLCPHLFRKHNINFVTQDGRKGLEGMQFDIIHVGGQLNEVPEEESE